MTDIAGIEGVLGGGAERSEGEQREGAPSASAAEAAAIAIAVAEAELDPRARPDAAAFLRSQKSLADLQIKYFDEDRELADLERQLAISAARRKQFSDRLKNGVQLLVALAASLVAVAAAVLIYGAATSRSVVVDSFKTPPRPGSTRRHR